MKIKHRHAKIIEIIRKKESASVEDLALMLDTSRETVRRDLTSLARLDKVMRVHGGATLPNSFGEGSFQQRMSRNVEAKTRIADKAASLFDKGETLFVDTGSTTLYFAEKLATVTGLTIVTNSTEIARTVSIPDRGIKTFVLGGEFSCDNRQTVGAMAISHIRTFRAHHCVLTIGALDGSTGAMDFNAEEAQVAQAMIEQSQSLTILMDGSKYNQFASFKVCSLDRIDRLVCEKAPPGKLAQALESSGVELILAE